MPSFKPLLPPFRNYKKEVFQKAAKVSDFIYQIGETENLRLPSRALTSEELKSDALKEKISYLKKCLLRYRELTGVGRAIAAVQIGIPERFAAIYTPEKLVTIINPSITNTSKSYVKYPEICMSANPIIAPVIRPSWIEFSYIDENGQMEIWQTKDDTEYGLIMNRVFQHEIDHMDGIINIDKASSRELILHSDPTYYDRAAFEEIKND